MNEYVNYMYSFQYSELRDYLGENIIENYIEWVPSGDTLLTKERMINMIRAIHGNDIFRNRDFRRSLLQSMRASELTAIRDKGLKGKERTITDPDELIEAIVRKPWKRNELSLVLAETWGISEEVFDTQNDDVETINTVSAGERFFELLDYQYYIKQRALTVLNSGNLQERLLIHMPTGTGKTKTAMHTIVNYFCFSLRKKGLIIWVAHTIELLLQAYETFKDVWSHIGDGEVNLYKMWSNAELYENSKPLNGIMFCGLSKLMSLYDSNAEVFARLKTDCQLIVFDEAHKASAEKTKKVIENILRMPEGFSNRALLGLTATPGRTTENSYDNNLLTNMFGNKLIGIDARALNAMNFGQLDAMNRVAETNIIRYFQERRILARIKAEKLEYNINFTEKEIRVISSSLTDLGFSEKDFSTEQLKVFATNKNRNYAIVSRLRELYQEQVPTIVFACSVEHAKMLSATLLLYEIPNSLVIGNMLSGERKEAIARFKNEENNTRIIINYEVLTTGFDSTNIRCVFITRPTQSIVLYSQMLGRGLRGPMMGGNEECLLIDIEDNLKAFDNETAFSHFNDYWNK